MVKKNEKESPRALNEEDLESVTAVVVVVATVKEKSMKANQRTELQSFSNRRGCAYFDTPSFIAFGDSGGIQTHNLLIRSQMLYSVELRNHFSVCGCKGTNFF